MKRTRLKAVSKKRQRQNSRYQKLKESYIQSHWLCERCNRNRAIDIHHKAGRTGELLCAVEYFMAICRRCHDWVHENPAEAQEGGFTVRLRERYLA